MRLHRFIGSFDFGDGFLEIADPKLVEQLTRVLRLKAGDRFVACDGNGRETECVIEKVGTQTLSARVIKTFTSIPELHSRATLYCAMLKRENFEIVVQKATELGVAQIVPILTERTVKQSFKKDRLEKIMQEAAEQSGRGVIPNLDDIMNFEKALEDASLCEEQYFFDFDGEDFPDGKKSSQNHVALFIGPEGGWTDEEREAARGAGCVSISLGRFVLRAETAAIAACFLAMRRDPTYHMARKRHALRISEQ